MKLKATIEELREFKRLLCCCKKPKPRKQARVTLTLGPFSVTFDGDFMATLPDDKSIHGALQYVDAKGFPAQVDGVPSWTLDPADALTMTVAADGMSADFSVNTGAPGTSVQGTINADADLGSGVVPLVTLFSIDIVAGQAVAGVVSFGDPT